MTPPLTKALCALLIAGGLAACDITPARTLWALRNVDPVTTDPEAIRLALRIPQGFRPQITGMTLTGTLNATDTLPAESKSFAIVREPSTQLPSWMRRAGAPLYGYKISEADLSAFRAFQLQAAKAKGEKRGGSISLGTEVCRLASALPAEIPISAFIKTAETDEFVPLFEDKDLLDEVTSEELDDIAPLC